MGVYQSVYTSIRERAQRANTTVGTDNYFFGPIYQVAGDESFPQVNITIDFNEADAVKSSSEVKTLNCNGVAKIVSRKGDYDETNNADGATVDLISISEELCDKLSLDNSDSNIISNLQITSVSSPDLLDDLYIITINFTFLCVQAYGLSNRQLN
ncbi:hypothetical protein CL622_03040 [archaeon]|nr:hypothetical protein [archaeon]